MSKRTRTTYHCDVCRVEVDYTATLTDYKGTNFGLCDGCREKGYSLRDKPLSESPGMVCWIVKPDGDTADDEQS